MAAAGGHAASLLSLWEVCPPRKRSHNAVNLLIAVHHNQSVYSAAGHPRRYVTDQGIFCSGGPEDLMAVPTRQEWQDDGDGDQNDDNPLQHLHTSGGGLI
jgi:hypothetical protein